MSSRRPVAFICGLWLSLTASASAFLPQQQGAPTRQAQAQVPTRIPLIVALQESNQSPQQDGKDATSKKEEIKPILLEPFPEAADPLYAVTAPVGQDDFIVSREGGPTQEELANENILKIVLSQCTDLEVNTLVWKALGYRFDADGEEWKSTECFPNWREKYPTPPDLIGMRREYSREIDQVSLRANQALVRSVPVDNKQSLKEHMKPLGWKGFQYKELTPNLTRRAQVANWLVFFREELFGYSVEELREKREKKKQAQEARKKAEGGTGDEWSPPVREVY